MSTKASVTYKQEAHDELCALFADAIAAGWKNFMRCQPECCRPPETLTPQIASAVDWGYGAYSSRSAEKNQRPSTKNSYVERLNLADLHHAASCLRWDTYPVSSSAEFPYEADSASVTGFLELIDQQVAPTLRRKFGGVQRVSDALDNLAGHVMVAGGGDRVCSQSEDLSTGTDTPESGDDVQPRLARFSGRSTLVTWLTGIGIRLVLDRLRNRDRDASGDTDCNFNSDSQGQSSDLPERAQVFLRKFFPSVVELYFGITDSQKLGQVADASDIPVQLRNALRGGLTDRQKLVFQMLYFHGSSPSQVADILGVSRPYVSQCISSFRMRLSILARQVTEELAAATSVDAAEIGGLLDKLLEFLRHREWDSEWDEMARDDDDLQHFVRELKDSQIQDRDDKSD
jgi:RNA polymerase sigma factor (sigma-70 family)